MCSVKGNEESISKSALCAFSIIMVVFLIMLVSFLTQCFSKISLENKYFDGALDFSSAYVPVLIYHHFQEEYPTNNGLIVSEVMFDEQIRALRDHGYHSVTVQELIDFVEFGARLPENPILITIDDGYSSNLEIAAPILEKYGMNATIFSIYIFSGQEYDPCTGFPISVPYFSFQEAAPWVEKGVIDIQCHTYDMHRIVSEGFSVRDGMLKAECESREDYNKALKNDFDLFKKHLKEELGSETYALAFPYGYVSNELLEESKKNGMKLTVTTECHGNYVTVKNYDSLHMMGRIAVYDSTTGEDLIANLVSYNEFSQDSIAVPLMN